MPYQKITIRPGINTMATQLANEGGWSQSNLIRYRQGFLEKIGGWAKLFSNSVAGLVRALHAYEDLSANKNLLIGTDAGLQVYATGPGLPPTLQSIKLARRTDTALFAGTNAGTIIGNAGSPNITIVDPGHGASVGDQVSLPVTLSVGGIIIPPQIVSIVAVTANNWLFINAQNLVSNANTAGSFGTPPVFSITSAELSTQTCRVTLPAHGLAVNNTFQVQFAVQWQNFPGGVSVPAGSYTVASVIDANRFTISTPGLIQGALASGAEGGFDATQPSGTIDGLLGLVYYIAHTPISPNGAWYVDNFGGNVIIGLGNGGIYQFVPPISAMGTPAAAQIIANAPLVNAVTFVAMPQAQIVVLGSESVIGSGVQDPLMVRWCDAANPTVWTASITNQAGSFRLSRGSLIVGGIQASQTILVWTDIDLWAMTYIQPPLVYGFTILGAACGLIAPKARVILGRNTYWMGQKSFWEFGDNGVRRIECPIWDTVFPNLSTNPALVAKIFAGADEPFGEIIWFFPSTVSTGECDSYVKWNPALGDQGWDYGLAPTGGLSRTAWLGVSVFGMPLSTDLNLHVMQHETGTDNDTAAMTGVYAETGFFDIGQGDSIPLVNGMIPDVKWTGGSGASLTFTLWGQDSSGEALQMAGPYTVTPTTHYIPARMRKRQIALRVDWAPVQGFSARLGAIRARIQPAGRRP